MKPRSILVGLTIWAVALGAAAFIWKLPSRKQPPHIAPLGRAVASVYELGSVWTTDDDRSVRLRSLGGKYVVAAMIFTRCPSVCPTLVRQLLSLDRDLPEHLRESTRFALFSMDPQFDTIERLREYRARMGLSPDRWTLLRSPPPAVREFSAAIGFNFGAEPGGLPTHSKLVTLLGPHGDILLQRADVSADPSQIARSIEAAMQAEVSR